MDYRFFLWMHYIDPHILLIPPERYLIDFSSRKEALEFNIKVDAKNRAESLSEDQLNILKNLYEGEVRYVDESIGELLAFLEDKEILDDSLLFLMADHGHAFMEHQRFGHDPEILYNEVLHVPLLIYGLDFANVVNEYIQLLDVSPTIIDILNIEKPKTFLGKSLVPIVKGLGKSMPIFSESAKPDLIKLRYDLSKKVISCIKDGVKLIINEIQGTKELYDLKKDFQEKNNLYGYEKIFLFDELKSLIII